MLEGTAGGVLVAYFLYAVVLTVPVSLIVLWLYRRSVEHAMRGASEIAEPLPPLLETASKPRANKDCAAFQEEERSLRLRLAFTYTLAGAAAGAVWTWLYFLSPGLEFAGLRAFAVWYVMCWPVPFTFATLLAMPARRTCLVLAVYVLCGMVALAIWSVVPHLLSGKPGIHVLENLQSFVYLLVMEAAAPGLVILIASYRRIRGVSPLALAGLLVFSFSSFVATTLFVSLVDVGGLRRTLMTIGLNWFFMLATAPVGYLCWRLLKFLSAGYRRKSFSDVQLVVDLFWFIVAFLFAAVYTRDFGWKGISGLAGFVAYRGVAQLGLMLTRGNAEPGITLLVLRVFGFRGRSEKLYDSVVQRWRFHGPVVMIAGTDLATRTIDPDETLAFLAGDLRSQFVRDSQDLKRRLTHLDERRDPDGRFRVTEFFCHENTWSGTLATLLKRSDIILMDLRGFSEKNAGCTFEIQQLGSQQRLADAVFVVDRSTDVALLGSTMGASSPPSAAVRPAARLERVESEALAEREKVYRALCQLQTTQRSEATAGMAG